MTDINVEMLTELKRANDLKEQELRMRARRDAIAAEEAGLRRMRTRQEGNDPEYCHHGMRRDTYPGCRICYPA